MEIPWLWWGITCQLTHAGSPMRVLKDVSDQLRAHLDPMLAKLERSNRDVVGVEEPVLAGRVYDLLRRASGAARLGRVLRVVLDAGVNSGVNRGDLVVTLSRRGNPEPRVLRLRSQPEVLLRTPGDRDASSIPPAELAELARRALLITPGAGRDDLKRQVARILGWGRFTQALDELLESALPADLGVAAHP